VAKYEEEKRPGLGGERNVLSQRVRNSRGQIEERCVGVHNKGEKMEMVGGSSHKLKKQRFVKLERRGSMRNVSFDCAGTQQGLKR